MTLEETVRFNLEVVDNGALEKLKEVKQSLDSINSTSSKIPSGASLPGADKAPRKARKRREEPETPTAGKEFLNKDINKALRAAGAYRLAWLSGEKMALPGSNLFRKEGQPKATLGEQAMGAAAGLFVLTAIKDGIMKVVEFLMQASPLLRSTVKLLNVGFMQILKPFGDMVGMALRPIAKWMLQFARMARTALKEAGLSPKDPEYMSAYVKMLTSGLSKAVVGGITGGETQMDANDFRNIAEDYAGKKEERIEALTQGDVQKGLGFLETIATSLGTHGVGTIFDIEVWKTAFGVLGMARGILDGGIKLQGEDGTVEGMGRGWQDVAWEGLNNIASGVGEWWGNLWDKDDDPGFGGQKKKSGAEIIQDYLNSGQRIEMPVKGASTTNNWNPIISLNMQYTQSNMGNMSPSQLASYIASQVQNAVQNAYTQSQGKTVPTQFNATARTYGTHAYAYDQYSK